MLIYLLLAVLFLFPIIQFWDKFQKFLKIIILNSRIQ